MCDFAERPFILFWEVTRACALACQHCRAAAQPKAHPLELSHEEAMQLTDKIAELAPPMLVLTGGDPMMRRDIFDIIQRASAAGLRVALSPAATPRLLNTDFHRLREAGVVSMSLSLDGATQESHDAFRRVPHTFERTLKAAQMAREAGIQLQINTTVARSTIAQMPAFIELMKQISPDVWSVFLLVPTGRATVDDLPTAEQLEQLWQQLISLRSELPLPSKQQRGTTTAAPSCRQRVRTAPLPRATWFPHGTERESSSSPTPVRFNPAASSPSPQAMSARMIWQTFTARTPSSPGCGMMTRWAANAAYASTDVSAAAPEPAPTAYAATCSVRNLFVITSPPPCAAPLSHD